MRTKSITLLYKITQKEFVPPEQKEIDRRDKWIEDCQRTVEADWKPKYIKAVYTVYDPEIENQRRFFSVCVLYYALQNENMTEGVPDYKLLARYRETLLDNQLGYDVELVGKTVRRRKSTTDFKDVQDWNTFLQTLEETVFAQAGFDFPSSKDFWELTKAHGHDNAKRIAIEQLQKKLIKI